MKVNVHNTYQEGGQIGGGARMGKALLIVVELQSFCFKSQIDPYIGIADPKLV